MSATVRREAALAAALQDLLTTLGPLRVFLGFKERIAQEVFVAGVRNAEEVLRKLREGDL